MGQYIFWARKLVPETDIMGQRYFMIPRTNAIGIMFLKQAKLLWKAITQKVYVKHSLIELFLG